METTYSLLSKRVFFGYQRFNRQSPIFLLISRNLLLVILCKYEERMWRYVSLNDWNVPHVPQPRIIAPSNKTMISFEAST